ncbi:hypothetical protein DQ244_19005 [Blastococcus sp. TBT05-19]|uniref:hypothetical protein n=1 Tax=Blastococcus sp. TBT05-19 TaxID=2250581 RepID=UPI000DE9019D|nr:hypothetical protein [Blastococcus sp. TBT05-19]RBY86753.1 hypothetical protein DQ244_19005 [Blastococcus sp. TBT05-19]
MSEGTRRTGAPRDVPPPRPVAPPPAAPAEESPLARAARAVADAVAGMAGTASGRSAAGGLRDVVGAVAGAVAGAFGGTADDPGPAAGRTGDPGAVPPVGSRSPGALLGELLSVTAPRLPVRDKERLRAAHPGASDEEIADALVQRAVRATSGIGAAVGGLSAAHWLAPPSLLAVPLELGAETVLVAAVEIALIAELHELHDRRPPGDAAQRGEAYLSAWSEQRAVTAQGAGLGSLLGAAGMKALRRRLTRRLAGAVPSAAPLLIGAALAGRGNRRATESLARRVLADLRREP